VYPWAIFMKAEPKFNMRKYISQRRKLLKEEMSLVWARDKLTKQIRQVRQEMNGWDKYLLKHKE